MAFQRKQLIFESNPSDHDGGAKYIPGGLLVFLLQRSAFSERSITLLFCFIRPKLKSALSVVWEENDGTARPLTCINK